MPEVVWWTPAEEGKVEKEYFWPYLNRELEIQLLYGGDQKSRQIERIKSGKYGLVFVDSSIKTFDFLKSFPRNSLIVFFASDETYSLFQTFKILISKSVEIVIREYPARFNSNLISIPSNFLKLVALTRRQNLEVSGLIVSCIAGCVLATKQTLMRLFARILRKRLIDCPLGYTGKFAEAYDKFNNLDSSKSIILNSIDSTKTPKKSQKLFFAGQRGSYERRIMIRQALTEGYGPFDIFENFGGPITTKGYELPGFEYVKGLADAEYSLCPPGNYSAESFRYMESLLLYAYPLRPKFVLSDPLFINNSKLSWPEFIVNEESKRELFDPIYSARNELQQIFIKLRKVKNILAGYRREL